MAILSVAFDLEKELRMFALVMKLILTILGFCLVIYKAGWVVALGVFFLLWGNNIEIRKLK